MYEGLAASYARRLPSVALLRRAAREKPPSAAIVPCGGVFLKITAFCFIIAIGDCGALVFAIASK